MNSVIARPPFCRSVDAVFFREIYSWSKHWSTALVTIRSPHSYLQLYLIVIDTRRSLYDANKCLVSFCCHLCCVRRPKRPPARRQQLGSNGSEAKCRCSAVTDHYTGAILPLGTGLLTVFLNREVTVLPGLTSYSLLWEIIWD